jgi:hypothetical protein
MSSDWANDTRKSIDIMSKEENNAAKLLLVVCQSYVLTNFGGDGAKFWNFARDYAVETLFTFFGAPQKYL